MLEKPLNCCHGDYVLARGLYFVTLRIRDEQKIRIRSKLVFLLMSVTFTDTLAYYGSAVF
jgi:hypothetical protein